MNPKLKQNSFSLIFVILILTQIKGLFCQIDPQYERCREEVHCANITELKYPFWGGDRPLSCGYPGFQLNCQGDVAILNTSSTFYRVLEIEYDSQTLNIARQDLWNITCPINPLNTTLNFDVFDYASDSNDQNITIYYKCGINATPRGARIIGCDPNFMSFYFLSQQISESDENSLDCESHIFVPVKEDAYRALSNPGALQGALESGFSIQWSAENRNCENCTESGGVCGYDQDSNSFKCYCSDQPYDLTCNNVRAENGKSSSKKTGLIIGLSIAGAILACVALGCILFFRKRKSKNRIAAKSDQISSSQITTPSGKATPSTPSSTNFTKSIPSYPTSKSDIGRGGSYFGVHVFNFSELEEATDNFDPSKELGDGGFGTVYYGVLRDGRAVAVKRLYENNVKRVEQFMNEVEILTRLRHKNLVMLYGCTSKSSRDLMLVYEYIPNGTVDDHLHGNRAKSGLLSWPVRLNIAIETADALAYLHKSDIIHRDVKTNNVLLDRDFHVKVADFGLSRLFPTDVTHVSTAPQGTPGYVDPEYYQCYQLTEKSDVYSFGVMLIELISSLRAVDTNRHRHDINLSNMAINKIQNQMLHELVDPNLGFETNSAVRRMITSVAVLAFQCLQHERDMRPSMDDVLETLKGIQNEDLGLHKVEIVDILVDDDTTAASTPYSSG